jgi:hypothetical protein
MSKVSDFIKKEAAFFKERMYMLGMNKYHLMSAVCLEIIGWTIIFILGWKAYHCH